MLPLPSVKEKLNSWYGCLWIVVWQCSAVRFLVLGRYECFSWMRFDLEALVGSIEFDIYVSWMFSQFFFRFCSFYIKRYFRKENSFTLSFSHRNLLPNFNIREKGNSYTYWKHFMASVILRVASLEEEERIVKRGLLESSVCPM